MLLLDGFQLRYRATLVMEKREGMYRKGLWRG